MLFRSDGHQSRTSGTTTTLSSTDVPGHSNFIIAPDPPFDWRSPQNNSLWQGVNGINNPCPPGWRIPTISEWLNEASYWATNPYASPLKNVDAGVRWYDRGNVEYYGAVSYWSSDILTYNGTLYSYYLRVANTYSGVPSNQRAFGFSVRCIKD